MSAKLQSNTEVTDMLNKFFIALVSLTVLIVAEFNVGNAMIAPHEIYLGGLTYGSKIDEMKNIHGEPDAIFFGTEGYEVCEYADGARITYDKRSGQIKSIIVTGDTLNWRGDKRIGVGMNIEEWLEWHATPELVKAGDTKTAYLYFHYQSDPVQHVTLRNAGLFIVFNNASGIITEMRIYGDTDFVTFEESFDSVMSEMVK